MPLFRRDPCLIYCLNMQKQFKWTPCNPQTLPGCHGHFVYFAAKIPQKRILRQDAAHHPPRNKSLNNTWFLRSQVVRTLPIIPTPRPKKPTKTIWFLRWCRNLSIIPHPPPPRKKRKKETNNNCKHRKTPTRRLPADLRDTPPRDLAHPRGHRSRGPAGSPGLRIDPKPCRAPCRSRGGVGGVEWTVGSSESTCKAASEDFCLGELPPPAFSYGT